MQFDLNKIREKNKDRYGKASLEEVGKDVYYSLGFSEKFKTPNEFFKQYGFDQQIKAENQARPDRDDSAGMAKNFVRGLGAGQRSVREGYHGTRAMLSSDKEARQERLGKTRELREESARKPISVEGIQDIVSREEDGDIDISETISRAGKYAAGQAGAMLPIVGTIMAGAAAGAFTGARIGAIAGPKGIAAGALAGGAKGMLKGITAAKVGSAAGSFAAGYSLYAGGMYSDLRHRGAEHEESKKTAALYAAPAAGVSIIVPAATMNSILGIMGRDFVKNKVKGMISHAGISTVGEGVAEGIAESFVIMGEESVFGKTMTPEEKRNRIANAVAGGGIMGAGLGALGGGARPSGDIDTMIDAMIGGVEKATNQSDRRIVRQAAIDILEKSDLNPQQEQFLSFLKTEQATKNRPLNQELSNMESIASNVMKRGTEENMARALALSKRYDEGNLNGNEALELSAILANRDLFVKTRSADYAKYSMKLLPNENLIEFHKQLVDMSVNGSADEKADADNYLALVKEEVEVRGLTDQLIGNTEKITPDNEDAQPAFDETQPRTLIDVSSIENINPKDLLRSRPGEDLSNASEAAKRALLTTEGNLNFSSKRPPVRTEQDIASDYIKQASESAKEGARINIPYAADTPRQQSQIDSDAIKEAEQSAGMLQGKKQPDQVKPVKKPKQAKKTKADIDRDIANARWWDKELDSDQKSELISRSGLVVPNRIKWKRLSKAQRDSILKNPEPSKRQAKNLDQKEMQKLSGHFSKKLKDNKYNNINQARQEASQVLGKKIRNDSVESKQIEEAIELGVVKRAREIVKENDGNPSATYDALVDLYDKQPNLNKRTSTSVGQQAYSTPAPIAYVASRLAGVKDSKSGTYEPAAGNGMLLIEADAKKANVNEINELRADNLESLGFVVTREDASTLDIPDKKQSIITNPPFGVVKDSNGKNKKWTVDDFTTSQIDHAIALKALKQMDDDGKATLIVGGKPGNYNKRKNAYRSKQTIEFWNQLLHKYNVTGHHSISGDLYSKQGAKFPIDIITIEGKNTTGEKSAKFPAGNVPEVITSFEKLKELIDGKDAIRDEQGVDAEGQGGGVSSVDSGSKRPEGDQQSEELSGSSTGQNTMDSADGSGGKPGSGHGGNVPGGTEGDVGTGPANNTGGTDKSGTGSSTRDNQPDNKSGPKSSSPEADSKQGKAEENQGDDSSGTGNRPGEHSPQNVKDIPIEQIMGFFDDAVKEQKNSKTSNVDSTPEADKAQEQGSDASSASSKGSRSTKEILSDINDVLNEFGLQTKEVKSQQEADQINEGLYKRLQPLFKELWDKIRQQVQDTVEQMRQFAKEVVGTFGERVRAYFQKYVKEEIQGIKPKKIPKESKPKETEHQHPYVPTSKGTSMNVLMPSNMVDSVKKAMLDLIEKRGDIDEFVVKSLQFKSKEDMYNVLAAEQVDAVAMALNNVMQGKGFILGDQTGIGKGRVVASMIRYAKLNNIIPVFVTKNPELYADMLRDLNDIGERNLKPFYTNNDLGSKKIYLDRESNTFLKSGKKAEQESIMDSVVADGLGDYDAIFTTYNQLQPSGNGITRRQRFIKDIARDSLFILDESHLGSGDSQPNAKKGTIPAAAAIRDALLESPFGAVYSSATYAKRPNSMPLYFKTDMGLAAPDLEQLTMAIESGGVPMQQSVAAMLAESGQYIRRERSFNGVNFDRSTLEVGKSEFNKASEVMGGIARLSRTIQDIVKEIAEGDADDSGVLITGLAGVHDKGMETTNFASIMHNLVEQVLLGAKIDAVANRTIEKLKNNEEKPIIALSSTMGSFLSEYVKENNIKPGDKIDLKANQIFLNYLKKIRTIRSKKPGSDESTYTFIPDKDLPPEIVFKYNKLYKQIESLDLGNIPSSPIDYLIKKVRDAGYSIEEITGRDKTIEYDDDFKSGTFQTKVRDSNKAITDKFNSGELDALILNSSGSTGISLHSSSDFQDTRKRHMIIAQADKDINVFMQMLGRIFRTGQVNMPSYEILSSNIPAESRFAAILSKKMASLNANTTAKRDSDVTSKDIPDFFNEYGDEVVANIMLENQNLHREMGSPLKFLSKQGKFDPQNAVAKVTGKAPLLYPIEKQERLFDTISQEYKEYISMMEESGQSVLEAKTVPLDAKTLTSAQIMPPIEEAGDSPFGRETIIEEVEVNKTIKPYSKNEILNKLKNVYKEIDSNTEITKESIMVNAESFADDHRAKILNDMYRAAEEYKASLAEKLEIQEGRPADMSEEEFSKRLSQLEVQRSKVDLNVDNTASILSNIGVGQPVSLHINGSRTRGILINMKSKNTTENPAALSNWQLTFATAGDAKQISVPLSMADFSSRPGDVSKKVGISPIEFNLEPVLEYFDRSRGVSREKRYILTGNILAGHAQTDGKGNVINYTTSDGEVKTGIIMPRGADIRGLLANIDISFKNVDQMMEFLNLPKDVILKSANKALFIQRIDADTYLVRTNNVRIGVARKYILNEKALDALNGKEFVKDGKDYKVRAEKSEIRQVLEAYIASGEGFVTDNFKHEASEIVGLKESNAWEQTEGVSYRRGGKRSGVRKEEVEDFLSKISGYSDEAMSQVKVIQSVEELPIDIYATLSNDGAINNTDALYTDSGEIYIIANNINKASDSIVYSLVHEMTHKGIDWVKDNIEGNYKSVEAATNRVNSVLDKIAADYSHLIKKLEDGDYKGVYDRLGAKGKRRKLAEELLAERPGLLEKSKWYDQYVATIMSLIRAAGEAMGINIKITKAEVRDMMRQVKNAVTKEHRHLGKPKRTSPSPSYLMAGKRAHNAPGAPLNRARAIKESGKKGSTAPHYYRLRPGTRPSGVRADDVRSALSKVRDYSDQAMRDIKVVQSIEELPVGAMVPLLEDNAQNSTPAMYVPETGEIYFIADNLNSTEQAVTIGLTHEMFHKGLDNVRLGLTRRIGRVEQARKKVDNALDEIYRRNKDAVDKLGKGRYAGAYAQLDPEQRQRRMTEEYIALNQDKFQDSKWYDRYVSAVIRLVRAVADALGHKIDINDAEIRDVIRQARESVRREIPEVPGRAERAPGEGFYVPAMSVQMNKFNVFSQMEQTLSKQGMLPKSASIKKMIETIKSHVGKFKEVELNESGLIEYLESMDRGMVSRQEVLDYLNMNRIVLEQTQKKPGETMYDQHELSIPGGENYREVLLRLPTVDNETFHPFHWSDDPNTLLHLRLNERTDVDGKRVLFIEEVQSDWHQEGREKGYRRKPSLLQELMDKYPKLPVYTGDWSMVVLRDAGVPENKVSEWWEERMRGRVPNAPFKPTDRWAMLGMKRVIQDAVEQGFDRVAWTSADVQIDRYNLIKHIDMLVYSERLGRLYMFGKGGNPPRNSIAIKDRKHLDELVGEEIAERLMKAPLQENDTRRLSGIDLKTGGKLHKLIYDKILPKEVGKYIKKWGSKVKPTTIDGTEVWSFDITPKMRSAVMTEGQPMYLMAGKKSDIAQPGVLEKAKSMKKEGQSREKIWNETGWWEIVPGQWAFEIDDSKIVFDDTAQASLQQVGESYDLRDLIEAKDLFAAYPFLREVGVLVDNKLSAGSGIYYSSTNKIHINNEFLNQQETRGLLLHEIQHAIQEHEGFARGSTAKAEGLNITAKRKGLKDSGALLNRIKTLDKEISNIEQKPLADFSIPKNYTIQKATKGGWKGSWEVIDSRGKYVIEPQKTKKLATDKVRQEIKENEIAALKREKRELHKYPQHEAYNNYRLNTGEVEARLVQKRMDMTPEQRKDTPPWKTLEKMLREEGLLNKGQKPEDVLISKHESKKSASQATPEDFQNLARQQRGKPEAAMTNAQRVMGSGVMASAIEHAGDLIHRMNERVTFDSAGYIYVKSKVDHVYNLLSNEYGFLKEHEEGIKQEAKQRGISEAKMNRMVNKALKEYADAHRELPTYNEAQETVQELAIAIAESRIDDAMIAALELQTKLVDQESWVNFARKGLKEEPAKRPDTPNVSYRITKNKKNVHGILDTLVARDTVKYRSAQEARKGQAVDELGMPVETEDVGISNAKLRTGIKAAVTSLYKSASDRLKEAGMENLSGKIDNYFDRWDMRLGQINHEVRQAFRGLSKKDQAKMMKDFNDYQQHKENGRRKQAQEVLANSKHLSRLLNAWEALAKYTGTENQEVQTPYRKGMMVYDGSLIKSNNKVIGNVDQSGNVYRFEGKERKFMGTLEGNKLTRPSGREVRIQKGGYRLIGKIGKSFFPRMLREDVLKVLHNPNQDPKLWDQLKESLVREGFVKDKAEAETFLRKEYFSTEIKQDYFAGIELARRIKLPEMFYDYSWNSAQRYLTKWAQRISQVEQFGQSLGKFQGDWFERNVGKINDPKTKDYVGQVKKLIYNERDKSIYYKIMNWLNLFATATQLGNPATSILNLFGGSGLNVQAFGAKNVIKAWKELMTDYRKVQDYGLQQGILGKDLLNLMNDTEMQSHEYWGVEDKFSHGLKKFAEFTMTYGGYRPTENLIRSTGMIAAREWISDRIRANPGTAKFKQLEHRAKQYGINLTELIAENGSGPETAKFLRKSVNIPQGSYRIDFTPAYIDMPLGRFLFKYQKFGTQVSAMFHKNYIAPLLEAETNADSLRAFGRILSFFGVSFVAGSVVIGLRDELFGYTDPGPELDELEQYIADDNNKRLWAWISTRAWTSMLGAGAFGFFGNYAQMGLDYMDQQRVKNPLDPPGIAAIYGMVEPLRRLAEQGKLTARDLDDIGQRYFALYRANKRAGLRIAEEIGSEAKEVKLWSAEREKRWVRKITRRFAKDMDIEYKRSVPGGRLAKTERSPMNQELYEAIMVGDAYAAKAIYMKHIRNASPEEKQNIRMSMIASIRNRQPVTIGGVPSKEQRKTFFKWAKQNLSPENYYRVWDADRKYQRAANLAGIF